MPGRSVSIGLLATSLLACVAMAEEGPKRLSVRVALKAEPEFILNAGPQGKPERSVIDSVVAAAPAEILAAVEDWTGISDRGKTVTVKFYHTLHNSRFDAMSRGDGYSTRGSVKVAERTLVEHETHVRYQEVLSASDEKTFCVVGIYEFENRVNRRKCCVICRIEGDKPAAKDPQDGIIHPTGFATWTGPVVNASSVLFPPDDRETSQ